MSAQPVPAGQSPGLRAAEPALARSPADREAMIREAAYLLYESNGRRPGTALSDWVAAEAAIDAQARAASAAPMPTAGAKKA